MRIESPIIKLEQLIDATVACPKHGTTQMRGYIRLDGSGGGICKMCGDLLIQNDTPRNTGFLGRSKNL
jgi:hypothetical protein